MFSWYKYLIVNSFFFHLGFWSVNLFLIAPFPDRCLLVHFYVLHKARTSNFEMIKLTKKCNKSKKWEQENRCNTSKMEKIDVVHLKRGKKNISSTSKKNEKKKRIDVVHLKQSEKTNRCSTSKNEKQRLDVVHYFDDIPTPQTPCPLVSPTLEPAYASLQHCEPGGFLWDKTRVV